MAEVRVDGWSYGPSSFAVDVDGNTLSLTVSPPPPSAGVATLEIVSPAGTSAPVKIPFRRADSPILVVDPSQPRAGRTAHLYFAGPNPGDFVLAGASGCLTPFGAPPYFTFDIGGCGDPEFLPPPLPMDGSGLTNLAIAVPPALTGATVHLQFCDVNVAALLSGELPLPVSNVVSLTFP